MGAEDRGGGTCRRVGGARRGAASLAWVAGRLNHHELLHWDETFRGGSFVSAKKGALAYSLNLN